MANVANGTVCQLVFPVRIRFGSGQCNVFPECDGKHPTDPYLKGPNHKLPKDAGYGLEKGLKAKDMDYDKIKTTEEGYAHISCSSSVAIVL